MRFLRIHSSSINSLVHTGGGMPRIANSLVFMVSHFESKEELDAYTRHDGRSEET
jgi:hypothetical protein